MTDILAAVRWWAALAVVGLVAWPLAWSLLRRLPDRGFAFARPIGLLLVGYLFWLAGSLGFAGNDGGGIVLALLAAAGLSWLAYRRRPPDDPSLRDWLRANRRTVILTELLFLGVFALWVWVRAQNPAISATEKPMEFAFLNGVGRSSAFPPLDPWLSGYAISYYYFGYVMVSLLGRMAFVAEPVAFNLAIAWLVAGTATGAFGVVYNLIALRGIRNYELRITNYESGIADGTAVGGRLSAVISLLVGALAIGSLRPTNTWDWPTYLLLGSLAVAYYVIRTDGWSWRAAGRAAFAAPALMGLSSLLFLPFSANYGSAYSSASLWPGSYTHAWNYLLVYGLFLFFIITHLVRELRDWTTSWTEEGKRRMEPHGWLIIMGLVVFLSASAILLLRGYWIAPIALPIILVAGLLALRPELPAARRVVLALMAAAIGLSLVVEIVVLDGDVGRMNTVFKFYLQAWLMLSVACGAAAVWAWPAIRETKRLRTAWSVALGLLVFAAALYPLTATPAKWNIRMSKDAPHTLDGEAFLSYVEYGDTDYAGNPITIHPGDDLGIIDWLRRNVQGTPVVMEAHGGNPYRSIAARIAMYTGLPNVIGWDWHQRQQRAVVPGSAVTNRIEDVNNFYNTPDAAVARNILAQYGVEYIVVGTLENAYYWPQGLAKFDQMIADGTLEEVFRDGTGRIFRITN